MTSKDQTTESGQRADEVALFRYGLIADLVHLQPGERGIYARLREKAAQTYDIPGSRRGRVWRRKRCEVGYRIGAEVAFQLYAPSHAPTRDKHAPSPKRWPTSYA